MMTDPDDRLARDVAHRTLALDVGQSFLVQAPAGSGKTELLIQRYLALLAIVDRPERVLAMTFTRKAATEMRERIVAALRTAADSEASPVASEHETKTRALATAVLARDHAQGWQIEAHPSRLAIYTIDAFCASIVRQAPIATGLGSLPRFEEHAEPFYRQAAREALAAAPAGDADWRALLAHLDNDGERVVALLTSMLAKRDQWLPLLGIAQEPEALRQRLELVLRQEIDGELEHVRRALPPATLATLARCAAYASANLHRDGGAEELAAALARCVAAGGLPPAQWQHHRDWRALVNWLQVKGAARFRKSMDTRGGIPGRGMAAGAAERIARKEEVEQLLRSLEAEEGMAEVVHIARSLPPPVYDEGSWAIVAALLAVLPQAAAQLAVVFAAEGAVDFVELTLAALRALGSAEEPTDLLLRVDARYEHLLLDEFQDTSDSQYALLASLTAGWTSGDGRTLFSVGDPMQSIYRFRDAEVRLFLDAQASLRIGNVPVRFVDLARNFRSQTALVEWVNAVFPAVLGRHSNPWRGAVAFAPAVAMHPPIRGARPTLDLVDTPEAEADRVVQRVQGALAAHATDVAILVRARSALDLILPALRAVRIPFAAVELDALGTRQSVLDLASLAHALLQPADCLATMAVLRAPWCGLVLSDLLAVAPHATLGLRDILVRRHESLSDDGRARLDRVAHVLLPSLGERGRGPFTECVRGAWLALGGPAAVDEAIDLDAASRFFALLAEHEAGGDVRDWNLFIDALATLYPTPQVGSATRVQVMTLHKAKGLEFDTVILPGLARTPPRDDAELLRWRTRPRGLMLAPIKARGGDDDPIYAYLNLLAEAEADHELGRLLYVGATRARTRLHLVAVADSVESADDQGLAWKAPSARSALAKLWTSLSDDMTPPETAATPVQNANAAPPPPLRRFPADFALPALPATACVPTRVLPAANLSAVAFEWSHATAAAIGTVTHRALLRFAAEGIAPWNDERVAALGPRIRMELRSEGVDDAQLAQADADVERALRSLISDPRGRWLFDPAHADAASERRLAGIDAGTIVHVSLDRTFVADGVRWIVDFKTGRHEGGDTAAFLAREEERYRPQLERYARIVRALESRPIRLALYYPLVANGWREWAFPDGATDS